ncbi:hypothetical protein [Streptomyces sp. NPDC020917]|uniref:hypothetical protein n=1 Tax=Streptomyces sp. NPDC020917 TaxID=3365102 RepID=UPI0037951664
MARLYVRSGIDPDAPETAFAILVVDPEGTPGERAVAELGGCCYEGDGALYLVRTDGWAEQSLEAGRLTVGVAVHPAALRHAGVDPAGFPDRSSVDPQAVLVLAAHTLTEAALAPQPAAPTAVFTASPGTPVDDLLASEDDWPMLLAPPPGA